MLEEEWKFEIRALRTEADKLMGKLRREEGLGRFSLGPPHQKRIEDSFFDTIERVLSEKQSVLRLRVEDAAVVKLTFKRPTPDDVEENGGATRRHEFEAEPSIGLLERIREELAEMGITDLDISPVNFCKAGPIGVLLSWGFQEVLTALSQRCERVVYMERQQIATLALDDITFSTPEKQYKLREIEVERWDNAPRSLCMEFVELLKQRSTPVRLFPVNKSKYSRMQELVSREEDFNCEMKLIRTDPSLSADAIERGLLEMDIIPGYRLGNPPLNLFISDVYYDTGELKLLELQHYLRVREQRRDKSVPASQDLTLRRYVYTKADELRGSDQIKGPLDSEILAQVLRVLKSLNVVQIPDADITNTEASKQTLQRAGLQEVLRIDIDRRLWHVFDSSDRHFGNIKLDKVHFCQPQYKPVAHWEVEIGVRSPSDIDRIRAVAYTLMDEWGLAPFNLPKYETGHRLLRGEPPSTSESLEFVVRAPAWADRWGKKLLRQITDEQSFQQMWEHLSQGEQQELLTQGIEGLKVTVDKTLDKLRSMRQMQIMMAGALFLVGLAIVAGFAYLAAVGKLSLEQSIFGAGAGALLEILVLFPFRRLNGLSEEYSRLATLGNVVQIVLGMEGKSPVIQRSVETLIREALGEGALKAGEQGEEKNEGKLR